MITRIEKTMEITKKRYEKSNQQIKDLIINNNTKEDEINIVLHYERSKNTLGSYVTLDWTHKMEIHRIIRKIRKYSLDITQKRPLNFLMTAAPGSGKSHFVKCLAEKLAKFNVSAVTYNMSNLQKPEDFIHCIEAVRNLKVQDKLPILFLDEFDSEDKNYSFLLPLLWDGELQLSNRDLKLGKIIIILAGSKPEISKVIKETKKMEGDITKGKNVSKLPDLLSRINGGDFEIPLLDLVKGDTDRRVDKICLTLSLIQNRFGSDLQLVPWALLKFICDTKFRYGVRSIAQLIDLIPYNEGFKDRITLKDLNLPLSSIEDLKNSCLPFHLVTEESDDKEMIITKWKNVSECNTLIRFIKKDAAEEL